MAVTEVLSLVSPGLIVGVASVLFFYYFVIGAIVNYRKLSQFKGPPLAAISRLWLFNKTLRAGVYQAEKDALAKYGSPARIGPNLLVTDDPDVVRHMSAPGSKWTRSSWYDPFKIDVNVDTVFSTRDEKLHSDLKSREVGGYMGRDIKTLEPDMDARILDLVKLIDTKYLNGIMDLANVARFFTLDVLSTVAFGRPFGYMAANEDLWKYNEESGKAVGILEAAINHPTVWWILSSPLIQKLAAPKITDKTGMGALLRFAHEAVAERYATEEKVKIDMLNHFKEKGLNQAQCEAESHLQIIAGSDSTTGLLRQTMYTLAGSPQVYFKLQTEIDEALAAGKISEPIATYAEAQKLPYLSACIWEGLRMYPPLFGLKSKLAPPTGDTIKGIFYPPGTEIGLCDDAMCRRKDIFGDDADIYRPERWLEVDAATKNKFTRVVDNIFGSGRFVCLGRHIAMLELHKTFIELMKRYDWAIAAPLKGVNSFDKSIHVQSGVNVIVRPRSSA